MTQKPNLIGIAGIINSGKDTVGKIIQFLIHTEGKWGQVYYDDLQSRPSKGVQSNFQHYWEIKKFAGKLKQVASILTGIPVEKFEDQEFKQTMLGEEWKVWYVKLEAATSPIDKVTKRVSRFYLTEQAVKDEWFVSGLPQNNFEIVNSILTVRQFLQLLGTEAIRNGLHPDAWVNALFADYKLEHYSIEYGTTEDGRRIPIGENAIFPNWIITDARFPNELEAVKSRGGICILVKRNWSSKDATRQEEKIAAHQSETLQEDSFYDYILNNSGTIEDLVKEVREMLVYFKLLT